jgi:DNA-directed RNA polymerase subunit RPC12/RpoP
MGTFGWVVLVGVVGLLSAGGYLWLRARPRKQPKQEPQEHFKCPNCGRRLGYNARQAGHTGRCPRCRHPLTFPP